MSTGPTNKRRKLPLCPTLRPPLRSLVLHDFISKCTSNFLHPLDIVQLAKSCKTIRGFLRHTTIDTFDTCIKLTFGQVVTFFDPSACDSWWCLKGAYLTVFDSSSPALPPGIVFRRLRINSLHVVPLNHMGFRSLETLDLRQQGWLTSTADLADCSKLHTLNLGHCDQLTDISALGSCSELRSTVFHVEQEAFGTGQ